MSSSAPKQAASSSGSGQVAPSPLQPARAPRIPFAENVYGKVKRVRVFWSWIERFRAARGGGRLEILDFGCGTGVDLTSPIAHAGDEILGVDIHVPSIERARKMHPLSNLRFSHESAAELEERGARFDVIMCSEVLEHTFQPAQLLQQFHGLLRGEGLLIVSVPNGWGAFENLQRMDKLLHRLGIGYIIDYGGWLVRASYSVERSRTLPARPGARVVENEAAGYLNFDSKHVQFFRLQRLEGLFREAGFAIEDRRGRILLCGPYADFWARVLASARVLFRLNNWLADWLPFGWAADWMFALRRVPKDRHGAASR